jgi:hypothetical protein
VLRSFSVVGALAAAALALVIGIFAFTSQPKQDHPPTGSGPGQSGVAEHPVAATQNGQPQSGPLAEIRLRQQLEQEKQAPTPSPSENGFFSSSSSTASSFGGSTQAAPVRTCSPGLISGLLAAVGGLLGGSGSAC